MEQTALRPKPMPGQEPGLGTGEPGTGRKPGTGRRPHAARRRRRRLVTLVVGLLFGTALVLSGVGLGTVSATVIGMSKLAQMQKEAGAGAEQPGAPPGPPAPGAAKAPAEGAGSGKSPSGAAPGRPGGAAPGEPSGAPHRKSARLTLGVEAVDAPSGSGALLVGVHDPGPGYTAGLVRGDTLVAFGGSRITSAGDLAEAVAAAHPGKAVAITVRHRNGSHQALSVVPGVVT